MAKVNAQVTSQPSVNERWWERGRDEESLFTLDPLLLKRAEWLPEEVLYQLIAPARNGDVIAAYIEFDFP